MVPRIPWTTAKQWLPDCNLNTMYYNSQTKPETLLSTQVEKARMTRAQVRAVVAELQRKEAAETKS